MKTPVFTGSSVAIVTPFFSDGKINFEKLAELIDFQIANNTAAITICGTTGEASTLPDSEHMAAIEFTVKRVAKRVPVIAGTGSNDTMHALELSKFAENAGADALLIVTPYYNKTSQTGLIKHYEYIAGNVSLPIILYNVPSRTGMSFTTATYKELSKIPNINGVKEASGNFTLIAETLAACGDDFNLWSGNDDQIVPILALGGKGVISVLANVAPLETADICRLFFENKISESAALQLRSMELINALFTEVNPIPVKTALNYMGLEVGPLRMPLCDISAKNGELLKAALRNFGIKINI